MTATRHLQNASTAEAFARTIWAAQGGDPALPDCLTFAGNGDPRSVFAVGALAAGAVAAAGLAIGEWIGTGGGGAPAVAVDRRLAALWFDTNFKPLGWTPPPAWDPIAGDYRAADGWIRLHTNAPHHRAAALRVLASHGASHGAFQGASQGVSHGASHGGDHADAAPDKAAVLAAVAAWTADALETAIVAAGGCAAAMRDLAAWSAHPNGAAVAAEPLVAIAQPTPVHTGIALPGLPATGPAHTRPAPDLAPQPVPGRPLAGIRVLDLTRVLAGPVATRFLAGYGADVLRIDPPWWDEPALLPFITLGKRCARLDLRAPADMAVFRDLLSRADILVHGYRSDALSRLGLDEAARQAIRPGLIDVSLDAYGWTGPWLGRRGFDSLVQMSSGIAAEGMRRFGADRPTPLPVQALDHAAGYIAAAACVRGLTRRRATGAGTIARTSLARVAALLAAGPIGDPGEGMPPPDDADFETAIEATPWGPGHRMRPPMTIAGAPMRWDRPACELGSSAPVWLPRA